jgi:hypothetical protein
MEQQALAENTVIHLDKTDGVTGGCKHDDKSVDTARSDETDEITDD